MSRHAIFGGLAALALATPASAQRIPSLPFDADWRAPRVLVRSLPIDDRIAPFDFASAISMVYETRAGEIPGPGADDWIESRFRAAGKIVFAAGAGHSIGPAPVLARLEHTGIRITRINSPW